MTTRILRLCLPFLLALFSQIAFAQLPSSVDIKLERGGAAGDSLRVYVRSNGTTFEEVVSNIVLTIKYDSLPGVTGPRIAGGTSGRTQFCAGGFSLASNPSQPFSGTHLYKTYTAFGFSQLIDACPGQVWPADTWILIARIFIQNASSPNCRYFQVADLNDPFAQQNNISFYISLNGADMGGEVISSPISMGPDGDNDGIGNACDSGCSSPVVTNITSNSPICSNESLALSASATGDAPLSFSWSGTGNISNGSTANASVENAATGIYSVTVSNSCGSVSQDISVTVNPQPSAPSSGTYGPLCSNASPITLGGSPSGGVWTGTGVSGSGPYTFNPNVGTQTLMYTHTSDGCSNSATTTITVNPQPSAPSPGTYGPLCSNASPITLGGSPSGGAWTGTGVSGSGPYTFDPNVGTQMLTYTITSNGCSNSATTTITVNPQPSAPSTGTYGPLCSNASPITLGGSPSGGVWTGTGVSGSGPYTFNPNVGTQMMTYTITSNGCSNSATTTITVNPQPSTPSPGTYGPLCSNASPITLGGSPSGGVWTGTGVSGSGPYTFNPNVGTQTLTYTITSNGCSNSATTTITVNPQPAAPSTGTYGPLCSNASPITLGGSPSGGVWTGAGVSGGGPYTFNPNVGTQTLTYTISNGGCTSSATTTIDIQSAYWNMQTTLPSNNTISNTTISAISYGSNNGATTLIAGTSASFGYAGASGGNNAGATAYTGAFNAGTSTYFAFTVTPATGTDFTLNGISLDPDRPLPARCNTRFDQAWTTIQPALPVGLFSQTAPGHSSPIPVFQCFRQMARR
jgi:hypothetical protein